MRHPRYCLAPWHFMEYHQHYPLQYPCPSPHGSTSPTLPTLANHPRHTRYPRKNATHDTHASTPPTQARHSHHPCQHATHTNTPLARMQACNPRHTHQHEQHAISQTRYYLSLTYVISGKYKQKKSKVLIPGDYWFRTLYTSCASILLMLVLCYIVFIEDNHGFSAEYNSKR